MTSNFGRSYLLRLNFDLGVLRLNGNPIESKIHSYSKEDRRCLTEVIDRARPGQVSSSVQDLTAYDLQLRKVITPSSELRFGYSWTLWKVY